MEQYNTLHINNLEFTLYENPLYVQAIGDNVTVSLLRVGGWSGKTFRISKTNLKSSYYDYDWGEITLNRGERVYWYSEDENQYSDWVKCVTFQVTGTFKVGGNIQSLVNYSTSVGEYAFMGLFEDCENLVDASDLSLPATTLAEGCYMFMFSGCSLQTAPALPATTLAPYCYSAMFNLCLSLTTAPELPATTLAQSCYSNMFYNCRSLNYIKCMIDEYPSTPNDYMSNWVYGVPNTGTFVKSPNATWKSLIGAYNGIPNGWTVVDAS